MSLLSRLARYAAYPQARRMADKARAKASDPQTRRQVEELRQRAGGRPR